MKTATTPMTFVNKKQVCGDLMISTNTFNAWIAAGLPEYRIGRIILIKQQELVAFIEAHSSTAVDGLITDMLEGME